MFSLVALFALCLFHTAPAVENDTFWLSRYDYEYKMLQKIVVMEQDQKNMKQLLDQQQLVIRRLQTEFTERVQGVEEKIKGDTGSTYVRWGRTTCPENGTETVYTGYIGGSHYAHAGGAVNSLYLPEDPIWGEIVTGVTGHSYIYGTEYQFGTVRSNKLFKKSLSDQDAPCSVCRSTRPSVIMIPARNACYDGWTAEYKGYIVAGLVSHAAASEYRCLDEDPEKVYGGLANANGNLFYITEAYCGSLKCPPYESGKELTCVVCTK